jgi:hypothetical protein
MARGKNEAHNPRRKVGRGLQVGDTVFHKSSGDRYEFQGHGEGDDTRGYVSPLDKPGQSKYEDLTDFGKRN